MRILFSYNRFLVSPENAMKIDRIFFLILILLLCACGEKRKPSGYRPDSDLINAFTELILLQKKYDPSFPVYQDSSVLIFEKYHINQETFRIKIKELNRYPERWEVFLQHVLDQIQSQEKSQSEPSTGPKTTDRRLLR
jgi:hypothetical protein